MESVQDRLRRLREERGAREKARIEKLRELNLKKYNTNESQPNSSVKVNSQSNGSTNRLSSAPIMRNNVTTTKKITENYIHTNVTSTKLVNKTKKANGESKPSTAHVSKNVSNKIPTKVMKVNSIPSKSNLKTNIVPLHLKPNNTNKQGTLTNGNAFKVHQISNPTENNAMKSQNSRKSIAVLSKPFKDSRKSIQPKPQIETKSHESVFDRLYKPKVMPKQSIDNNAMKLKMDPNYLRQVIRDSNLIINKRHTVFETKEKASVPVRRSISAVHLKRISKNELGNCIQKWASIGEKINKVHLNEINEDECVKDEKVISAVKSERKRVKFQTPVTSNFNTPKPAELQERLQKWLQKRGKSLGSYHHLQCFGLHHLPHDVQSVPNKLSLDNVEENKENIALDHDSDNDSYTENGIDKLEDQNVEVKNIGLDKWRRASYVSDSVGFNETCDTITSTEGFQQDELLIGALNDLSELLREGFDWEQCARWLRAIRERFPEAPEGAPYWECRAALEERRGDLPASVQCWERAIANGTEQSIVEANLDQLLDKFMQLKISPSSGRQRVADPKLLDVKNVFKSTIIRFAVQQAKLRQSNGTPRYTVTPVRRSSRLSCIPRATPLAASSLAAPPNPATPINTPRVKQTPRSARTPLSLCKSFHQAAELFPVEFKVNKALIQTP